MRVTRLEIRNFRSIKHLALDLGETTVFVGPNNAGKTAILDALRIALTRRWGTTWHGVHRVRRAPLQRHGRPQEVTRGEHRDRRRGVGNRRNGPMASPKISTRLFNWIETRAFARSPCERSVRGTTTAAPSSPTWEFLNVAREPLPGRSARRVNLDRFWRYLPVFYLSALRDVGDEFSPRSQFWGRLLKALEIPAGLESRALRVLDLLNRRLLKADPRLQDIAGTLSGATKIAAQDP